MKKHYFLIFLTFICSQSFGQLWYDTYTLTFDDPLDRLQVNVDTVNNPNNIWQIGSPQKNIFTSAFSPPNVIVTDTVSSYPTNDTSNFIITNIALGGGFDWSHTVLLTGEYYVNSDSLTDFGKIEFTPDRGTTWIDLINDTVYTSGFLWYSIDGHTYYNIKPTLTGNSNGWQNFNINLATLGPIFNLHDGDTLSYRFTFISDSIQTNKDGLMFDNLHFEDWVEDIPEIQNNNLISISPNPVSNELSIHSIKYLERQKVQVYNYTGSLLYNNSNYTNTPIDVRHLPNGIYLLKYSNSRNFSIKKFIVQH